MARSDTPFATRLATLAALELLAQIEHGVGMRRVYGGMNRVSRRDTVDTVFAPKIVVNSIVRPAGLTPALFHVGLGYWKEWLNLLIKLGDVD